MITKILCFISGICWAVGWYGIIPEPNIAFSASVLLMLLTVLLD